MDIITVPRSSAHLFAGCGGDISGLKRAGWQPRLAVEMDAHRCRTLRHNHPGLKVVEGPIQRLTLADYPAEPLPFFFLTFPCDHYTVATNVHGTWTGDSLYLEALREVILRMPELVCVENVWGMRKFKRVMETFRALPLYHCTELVGYGEDFTLQRKKRLFLLLHRQPFAFPPLDHYAPASRSAERLADYLEGAIPSPVIPPYIYRRLDGGYRDRPIIYHPERTAPVNLFTNYGRDRSLFLVTDPRCPRGVRPFHVREVANLHGFAPSYQFLGPLGACYDMVIDSVMPPMAHAIGQAANDYFRAIPRLAEIPRALGFRSVLSQRSCEAELEEARHVLQAPEPLDPQTTRQLALW
jgi:DNA (cytosine-5)-methyltransferase 1